MTPRARGASVELRLKESAGHGLRRAWSDGKNRRLEDCLNDVLIGIILTVDAKRIERAALERRRREWQEAERRRAEAEARRREEAERLQKLEHQAEQWARAERLRVYLDALEGRAVHDGIVGSKQFRVWMEWARQRADQLDPGKALLNALKNSAQ